MPVFNATHDGLLTGMREFYLAPAAISNVLGTYASGTARYHRILAPAGEAQAVYVVYRVLAPGQAQRVGMPSPKYDVKILHQFVGPPTPDGVKVILALFNSFYDLTQAGGVENRYRGDWGSPAVVVDLAKWDLTTYSEEVDVEVTELPHVDCELHVSYVKG